jgi:hypothetical protein
MWSSGEARMNHSLYSADRITHLKIVALALLAAIAVAGIGTIAHLQIAHVQGDQAQIEQFTVLKPGKPVIAMKQFAGRA